MTRAMKTVFGVLLLVGCMASAGPAMGLTPAVNSPDLAGQEEAQAAENSAGEALGDQGSIEPVLPGTQDVFIILRDMSLDYQAVSVRTIVASQDGASALVAFQDGTLADVEFAETAAGWSLRDIFYVAGSSETYRNWTAPWRRRVREAERFLASTEDEGEAGTQRRRAEELAALMWFEDVDESTKLWGLNPVTYRVMQTLQMMPALGGPMDPNRDIRRR
jgi:hypothetical protein